LPISITAASAAAPVMVMLLRRVVRVVVLVLSAGEPEKHAGQAQESKLRLTENGFETI
jgi:hypothetical protein